MCFIPFDKIKLYRMIHIDNIPHIIKYGLTRSNSRNSDPNYIMIGDTSLIENRKHTILTIRNENINIGNYIPFYFWLKMPMLYVIQNGYNKAERIDKKDIVYIVISLQDLINTAKNIISQMVMLKTNYRAFMTNPI